MAKSCSALLILAVFGSCVQSATRNYPLLRYGVPQPLIQALRPRGLRVSIPHSPGIQLFAFHGNINKALQGEGLLSQQIREPEGNSWVFVNSTLKLHVGDEIYYRVFVVKEGFGYSLEGRHHIKSLEEGSANCAEVVVHLGHKLCQLQDKVQHLEETNVILKKLLENDTRIRLDGVKVEDDTLDLVVQAIIQNRLHLPFTVGNVTRKRNGLVEFEVGNIDEKIEVLRAANKNLEHSKFSIIL